MLDRPVKEIVAKKPLVRLSPETTVAEAATAMTENRVGAILVFDGDELCGIVTERDLVGRVVAPALGPAETTLRDVMTGNPTVIETTATGLDGLRAMHEQGSRHLPVVDGGRIVGILSVRDLLRSAVEELTLDQTITRDLWEGFPV